MKLIKLGGNVEQRNLRQREIYLKYISFIGWIRSCEAIVKYL